MSQDIHQFNQDRLSFHQAFSSKVTEICAPLLKHLGISHFTYNRFYEGNRYVMLHNLHHQEGLTGYFEQELDKLLLHNDFSPLAKGQHRVLWASLPANPILENLKSYGIGNGLSIMEKKCDYVEAFHFATNLENTGVQNLYINTPYLFDQFILYFKEKLILLEKSDHGLPDWIYRDDFHLSLDKINTDNREDIEAFYKMIALNKYNTSYNNLMGTLSKRQMDVLHLLARGRTDKEIAKEYQISHRTVQSHTDEIKNKFNLYSRSDLIQLWEANPLLASLFKDIFNT